MELFYYRVLFILSVVIALNTVNGQSSHSYRIPQPTAAVLTPRGFRISIPDERGIVLFAFHGSINRDIQANEQGDYHSQTRIKSNGQWSYENNRYKLQRGDILNFWLYVQHENFGYKLENLRYTYPDHFVYNTNFNSNDDNGGLSSSETQNSGTSNVENPHRDNADDASQWQQPDYTTQRITRRTTTTTTTTALPYLVFEDTFNTQRPTVRPAATVRTTSRTSSPQSSSNYWPNTSQQQGSSSTQHRPSYNDNLGTTTTQQHPHNTPGSNYDYNDDIPNRQHHQDTSQSSQFGSTSNTQTHQQQPHQTQSQGNQFGQHDNQYRPTQHQGSSTQSQFGTNNNDYNNNNQYHHQPSTSNGIPFSQPDASQYGLNQPDEQNFNSQDTTQPSSQFGNENDQRPLSHGIQFGQQGNSQSNRPNQNCRRSITTVNKKRIPCKGTVIFEEQFDYNFQSRWSQDVRMPLENEDAEFVVYENYPSVWNVSNGDLNIFPKLLYQVPESGFSENDIRSGRFVIDKRDCTSFIDPAQECERQAGRQRILPPIVSAKFRSKKSFSFKYGRVEIRAKVPKGDWLFPQIYLEPSENKYRGTGDLPYLNGQIRMVFVRGNEYLDKDGQPCDGKILMGICVIAGSDTSREIARKSIHFGQEHFGNDFHTYSMVWTNTSIKFAVDDLEFGTDTGGYKNLPIPYANFWHTGTNMAPFDQEFHIALGVAAGGNADFPDDARTGTKLKKPWENTSPKAELNFYLHANEWHSTWNSGDSGLIVDYVKVTSV